MSHTDNELPCEAIIFPRLAYITITDPIDMGRVAWGEVERRGSSAAEGVSAREGCGHERWLTSGGGSLEMAVQGM